MTITGRVAQAMRILAKAHSYRQALQREAEARQAREEQAERQRVQRARDEYEDACARGFAETGGVYVPGDHGGQTLPGLLTAEQWQRLHNVDIYERRDW